MKNKSTWVVVCFVLFAIGIFCFLAFFPRKYPVPSTQIRDSTHYWDLPTGSRIAYCLINGKGAKKPYPVIYLHGGPGGSIYNYTIQSLSPLAADGYDVYFYDQIGGGFSDRLEDIREYTVDRHKKDLEDIVRKTGATKVILIGQSWGAILATQFALDNTEKVAKIIFASPGPILPVRQELALTKAPDSLHLQAPLYTNQQGNRDSYNLQSRLMLQFALISGWKLVPDREADEFATFLNQALNKSTVCDTSKALKTVSIAGFYAQIMTCHSFVNVVNRRSELKNLHVPVLILKGQCDNQKWGHTREYLELFPNHQLVVVPGAGHAIATEEPVLYLETIRDFLGR